MPLRNPQSRNNVVMRAKVKARFLPSGVRKSEVEIMRISRLMVGRGGNVADEGSGLHMECWVGNLVGIRMWCSGVFGDGFGRMG